MLSDDRLREIARQLRNCCDGGGCSADWATEMTVQNGKAVYTEVGEDQAVALIRAAIEESNADSH